MAIMLEITDRFNLTGIGLLYLIKRIPNVNYKVGDIFFDRNGNRFKVKAFPMVTYKRDGIPLSDLPVNVILENLSGIEVQGDIIASDMSAFDEKLLQ